MFKKTLIAGAVAATLAGPGVVLAAEPASPHTFTGNIGLFSQYVFRGLSQTNDKPALQGGFDYSHASGFYAGLWASNISWVSDQCHAPGAVVAMGGCPSVSLEVDTYFGYKNTFAGGDWNFDLGFLRYNYPGSYPSTYTAWGVVKPNTDEVYAALGYKWLSGKISYSLGDTFGFDDATGSYYAELNAAIPLGESGYTLGAHVGYQKFKDGTGGVAAGTYAVAGFDNEAWSYYDWKISISKEHLGLNWTLALKGTDAEAQRIGADGVTYNIWQNPYGNNLGGSQVMFSVQKTF